MSLTSTGSTTTNNENVTGATISTNTQDTFRSSKKSNRKGWSDNKEQQKSNIPLFELTPACEIHEKVKNTPDNKKILGTLIGENELNILFSYTNAGKSFMGIHIAEEFATNTDFFEVVDFLNPDKVEENKYYKLVNECGEDRIVLYVDFEMSQKRFDKRYTSNITGINYNFHPNVLMLHPKRRLAENRDMLITEFRNYIKLKNVNLLIIDNLTAISLKGEEADFAGKLMINLRSLLDEFAGLTIIVIAHTPKGAIGKALTLDSLAGSANYVNLADNVLAIGTATVNKTQRYIIQLKCKNYEILNGSDNVIQVEFKELNNGFKGYSFIGYESEEKLLRYVETSDRDREKETIIRILNNENISSVRGLGERLYSEFGKGKVSIESYKRSLANRVKALVAEGLVKAPKHHTEVITPEAEINKESGASEAPEVSESKKSSSDLTNLNDSENKLIINPDDIEVTPEVKKIMSIIESKRLENI